MKKDRHSVILELIRDYDVATQEELLVLLRERGFRVTQATVSRDVKDLRLVKTLTSNGIYKYMPETAPEHSYNDMFDVLFKTSLTKVDCAGNICVIRCSPGLAGAACATIDALGLEEIVGTIAGDDTIFMLCRTPEQAKELVASLGQKIRN